MPEPYSVSLLNDSFPPLIDGVAFTGGTDTGKKVTSSATSSSLKEVTMELGGKSPLIVFDDAALEDAVGAAMLANFYSSGQICSNGTRWPTISISCRAWVIGGGPAK